jgi:hypothetical protein
MSSRDRENEVIDLSTIGGTGPEGTPINERKDMPLPRDPKAFFQGGLFLIALLACAYLAREVLLPVLLAFILKQLTQPIMRFFLRDFAYLG